MAGRSLNRHRWNGSWPGIGLMLFAVALATLVALAAWIATMGTRLPSAMEPDAPIHRLATADMLVAESATPPPATADWRPVALPDRWGASARGAVW
ncbi:MAG TPA: hypothetical protein PK177_23080, partial [Burkholderiaceae bacterium]|nr:hypothetical protein [Burkholderiaceae bacterium]